MTDTHPAADNGHQAVQRKLSTPSSSNAKEVVDVERASATIENNKEEEAQERGFNKKLRVVLLIGLAALILGWWISSTVLKTTRGRWQVYYSPDVPCVLKSPVGLYKQFSLGSF